MSNIINRMMIGTSLIGITFSLGLGNAYAQTCEAIPSCAELGYVASSCPSGTATLKCPFDLSKVFCAKDCDGYSLTSCPANADCEQCWDGKYKKLNCKEGYLAEGDNCVVNPCEGHPATSIPAHCGYYTECQSGPTMKYRCTSCENGYVISKYDNYPSLPTVASCIENPCYSATGTSTDTNGNVTYFNIYDPTEPKYQLTSKNDPNCANDDYYYECKSGSTSYYMCTKCINNTVVFSSNSAHFYASDGKCISGKYQCPSSKGWSTSSSFTGTADTETCYEGNHYSSSYVRYRPKTCSNGYHMNYSTFRCDRD